MAISNYTALTGAVAAWLDVGTADISAVVSDLVLTAEKRIMRELRTPDMEVALSDSITTGGLLPVPSDYIEMKFAYVDANPTQYIQMVSPSYIYERYPTRSGSGKPIVMARDGANFIFGRYPDSSYTIKGTYYSHLTAVETSANPLFTANPDLYLFACLAESEPIIGRDRRIQIWESKYRMVKELVNGESDRSNFGGNMAVRPL
jgi:hypothetical protein